MRDQAVLDPVDGDVSLRIGLPPDHLLLLNDIRAHRDAPDPANGDVRKPPEQLLVAQPYRLVAVGKNRPTAVLDPRIRRVARNERVDVAGTERREDRIRHVNAAAGGAHSATTTSGFPFSTT